MESEHKFSRTLSKMALTVYICSFILPDLSGILYFAFGVVGIATYPIWMANPFFWFATLNVLKGRSRFRAIAPATIACGFALLPFVVLATDRVETLEFAAIGIPYWLWTGSMVMMLIASILQCFDMTADYALGPRR